MSSLARWTYVAQLTVWPFLGNDKWQNPTYGQPFILMGDWEYGGKVQTDNDGQEFVPASTYYFEAEEGSELIPERNWFVLRGDHLSEATPPKEAERIKKVGGWNMSMFGAGELPDWVIYT